MLDTVLAPAALQQNGKDLFKKKGKRSTEPVDTSMKQVTWKKRKKRKPTPSLLWEVSMRAVIWQGGTHACVDVLANVNTGENLGNEPAWIPDPAFVRENYSNRIIWENRCWTYERPWSSKKGCLCVVIQYSMRCSGEKLGGSQADERTLLARDKNHTIFWEKPWSCERRLQVQGTCFSAHWCTWSLCKISRCVMSYLGKHPVAGFLK